MLPHNVHLPDSENNQLFWNQPKANSNYHRTCDLLGLENCAKPRDCLMNVWGEWGACSKNCGGGISTRTRKVLRPAAHGGRSCPSPTETKPCNTQGCPVDCVMRPWDPWSPCSEECDGGIQFRHRTIETPSSNAGKSCSPDLSENRECTTQGCPVDCITSPWADWSNCSAKCGEGTKTRDRSIVRPPKNGGSVCGAPLTESESCNEGPCPEVVECEMSPWSSWGTCGQNNTKYKSNCKCDDGNNCEYNTMDDCRNQCGSNCHLPSDYIQPKYGSNGKACGSGKRTRTRSIHRQPDSSGTGPVFPCPPLRETGPCELGPCAVDCEMSDWSPWAKCSKTCGGGEQTRTRSIKTNPSNGGKTCDTQKETRTCNEEPCSVDGQVSTWSIWEDKSECKHIPQGCAGDCGPGGYDHKGPNGARRDRSSSCTPSSGWSGAYENGRRCCDRSCPERYPCNGTKTQRRTRHVTVKQVACGKPPPSPLIETQTIDCTLPNCCDPGKYLENSSCLTCPKNYLCKGGTSEKESCPSGYFQNKLGQSTCKIQCEQPWAPGNNQFNSGSILGDGWHVKYNGCGYNYSSQQQCWDQCHGGHHSGCNVGGMCPPNACMAGGQCYQPETLQP